MMRYLAVVAASLLCLASIDANASCLCIASVHAALTCGSNIFTNCSDIADFIQLQADMARVMLQLPARPTQGRGEGINEVLGSISKKLTSLLLLTQPFTSCQEVQTLHPDYPSGYYSIIDSHGKVCRIYCNMELSTGGYARVAYLDMTNPVQHCPPELSLREQNGTRACGRPETYEGSCASLFFQPPYPYTEVYGRVNAYQFGRTGGINPFGHVGDKINDTYVDGVSITRGPHREHVWTFITSYNGIRDLFEDNRRSCPCSVNDTIYPMLPNFLDDHWFCESGVLVDTTERHLYYTDDPLWDGKQCGPLEPCCNTRGQPWFHRSLDATSDYLELRLCDNDGNINMGRGPTGDTPIILYELYVK